MQSLYFNRELSYLKFERRILEEAADKNNPLFERLRFISIFSSNLDEFFMVRVAELCDRLLLGKDFVDSKTGMTPKRQLTAIYAAVRELYTLRDNIYSETMAELSNKGIYVGNTKNLGKRAKRELENYFLNEILPVLSPQIVDAKHPFGHLENKLPYIGVSLKSKKGALYGIIPFPKECARLYKVAGTNCFLLLEDIIYKYADKIFGIYKIRSKIIFRVTRSSDIKIDCGDEEESDYRNYMSRILKTRPRLAPVRFEVSSAKDMKLVGFILKKLGLSQNALFVFSSPLDFSFVSKLISKAEKNLKPNLFYPPLYQRNSVGSQKSIIKEALCRDIVICTPYESMKPIISLISEAASDDKVVTIKMTLYRVSSQSQIVSNLCAAAENGIDVTVMIELSARFDEENNIAWSTLLEESGCHILYGIENRKVHSKLLLITKKTDNGFIYITNIGTGNYNEVTSRSYTDISLITSNFEIGKDAAAFFRNLTLSNPCGDYKYLLVSPFSLKSKITELIREQADIAKKGEDAQITMKMNSLTDKEIIDELIFASKSGVKIRLLVRGICCLRPNVKGYTENIEVKSIVGRFLEHSRIYCFGVGDTLKLYISSADMMTRNTERRVETAVPIIDDEAKKKILKLLELMFSDNVKARVLQKNGNYLHIEPKEGEKAVDSQFLLSNKELQY